MSFLELDFASVVIGYAIGVALMWSIHTLLFDHIQWVGYEKNSCWNCGFFNCCSD